MTETIYSFDSKYIDYFDNIYIKKIIEILSLNLNDNRLKLLFNYFFNNILKIEFKKINYKHYKWTVNRFKYPIKYSLYPSLDYNKFVYLFKNNELLTRFLNKEKYKKIFNIKDDIILNILYKLSNNYFIGLDIQKYIENNINKCNYYDYDHIEIFYFYKKKINNNILKHIYIISKLVHSMNPIYKIKLLYFDIPLKKKLNSDDKLLSSNEINSGSSLLGVEICIWRREELYKVLFHELIHYLNLDLKYDKIINSNEFYFKINNNPILINESFTEIQAQLFHTIYISIIKNLNEDVNIVYNIFTQLYINENRYNWYQVVKILKYFDIKEFNSDELNSKFNQTSNGYSYYILKSILNLKICDIIFLLDYIKKILNINDDKNCNFNECKYVYKYINNYNNSDSIKCLNYMLSNIKFNNITKQTSLKMVLNTLYPT